MCRWVPQGLLVRAPAQAVARGRWPGLEGYFHVRAWGPCRLVAGGLGRWPADTSAGHLGGLAAWQLPAREPVRPHTSSDEPCGTM